MRSVVDGVLVSTALPRLRLRPSDQLRYVGAHTFELKGIAAVERHVFAEDLRGSIRRMLVVHFESFLPDVSDVYRYRLVDEREIGGATYGCATSELDLPAELRAEPDAEMAHTVRALSARGLRLGDHQAVARFARILGEDRRSELLIFYHEIDGLATGLVERAVAAFAIE